MKKIYINLIILGLTISLLSSCAAIKASSCTTNAAYANGVNDARNSDNMNTNYASFCKENQTDINNAYRSGYESVISNNSGNIFINAAPQQQCINNMGDKVCGYNCVKSFNNAQCASSPDQQCLNDGFGNIACGYSCIKSMKGVKCASNPNQTCVTDTVGNIVCGKNCQVRYGQIKCDGKRKTRGSGHHNF